MKVRLFCLNVILLYSITIVSSQNRVKYISCQKVAKHINYSSGKQDDRWYLINVAPSYICSECTIPGSINIPAHILDKMLKNHKKWSRSRKIIVCGTSDNCSLAQYAYEIIKKLGFDDVLILQGGIAAWKKDGYPIIGSCNSAYLEGSL